MKFKCEDKVQKFVNLLFKIPLLKTCHFRNSHKHRLIIVIGFQLFIV